MAVRVRSRARGRSSPGRCLGPTSSSPKNVSCLGFPRWVTWWGMPGAITRANRAMGETNPATTPRQEFGMVSPELPRDNDQMNMVGHQAICPDRDLLCAAELRHELEVVLVVLLTEERLLSGVSPLGNMVGHARSYHAPIEPWWETNPATTPRQELGMVSPELPWWETNPATTPRQELGMVSPELPNPASRVRYGVPGTPWCPRNSLTP